MKKNWYVLHVLTGGELEVKRQLRERGIDALVPQEIALIRRGGRWHEELRILFPGYVFVYISYTVNMHYIFKETAGAIRLLPKEKPMPLLPKECAWLIMCAEEILPPSKVDFSGKEPVIVDGPLKDLEEYIRGYDRHRRKVSLRIPVLDEGKDIVLSILPV